MDLFGSFFGSTRNSVACSCDLDHPNVSSSRLEGTRVSFLFDEACRTWGSTYLRSFQLATFLRLVDPSLRVEVGSIQDHQPGSADLVILSKTAVAFETTPEAVSNMSELQTKILVDLVDS